MTLINSARTSDPTVVRTDSDPSPALSPHIVRRPVQRPVSSDPAEPFRTEQNQIISDTSTQHILTRQKDGKLKFEHVSQVNLPVYALQPGEKGNEAVRNRPLTPGEKEGIFNVRSGKTDQNTGHPVEASRRYLVRWHAFPVEETWQKALTHPGYPPMKVIPDIRGGWAVEPNLFLRDMAESFYQYPAKSIGAITVETNTGLIRRTTPIPGQENLFVKIGSRFFAVEERKKTVSVFPPVIHSKATNAGSSLQNSVEKQVTEYYIKSPAGLNTTTWPPLKIERTSEGAWDLTLTTAHVNTLLTKLADAGLYGLEKNKTVAQQKMQGVHGREVLGLAGNYAPVAKDVTVNTGSINLPAATHHRDRFPPVPLEWDDANKRYHILSDPQPGVRPTFTERETWGIRLLVLGQMMRSPLHSSVELIKSALGDEAAQERLGQFVQTGVWPQDTSGGGSLAQGSEHVFSFVRDMAPGAEGINALSWAFTLLGKMLLKQPVTEADGIDMLLSGQDLTHSVAGKIRNPFRNSGSATENQVPGQTLLRWAESKVVDAPALVHDEGTPPNLWRHPVSGETYVKRPDYPQYVPVEKRAGGAYVESPSTGKASESYLAAGQDGNLKYMTPAELSIWKRKYPNWMEMLHYQEKEITGRDGSKSTVYVQYTNDPIKEVYRFDPDSRTFKQTGRFIDVQNNPVSGLPGGMNPNPGAPEGPVPKRPRTLTPAQTTWLDAQPRPTNQLDAAAIQAGYENLPEAAQSRLNINADMIKDYYGINYSHVALSKAKRMAKPYSPSPALDTFHQRNTINYRSIDELTNELAGLYLSHEQFLVARGITFTDLLVKYHGTDVTFDVRKKFFNKIEALRQKIKLEEDLNSTGLSDNQINWLDQNATNPLRTSVQYNWGSAVPIADFYLKNKQRLTETTPALTLENLTHYYNKKYYAPAGAKEATLSAVKRQVNLQKKAQPQPQPQPQPQHNIKTEAEPTGDIKGPVKMFMLDDEGGLVEVHNPSPTRLDDIPVTNNNLPILRDPDAYSHSLTLSAEGVNNASELTVKPSGWNGMSDVFDTMPANEKDTLKNSLTTEFRRQITNETGLDSEMRQRMESRPSHREDEEGNIINLGNGVFNPQNGSTVPSFTVLGPYAGVFHQSDASIDRASRHFGSERILSHSWGTTSKKRIVDGWESGNVLRNINTHRIGNAPAVGEPNVAMVRVGKNLTFYVTIKPVKPGEEYIVDYGPWYNPHSDVDNARKEEQVARLWLDHRLEAETLGITLEHLARDYSLDPVYLGRAVLERRQQTDAGQELATLSASWLNSHPLNGKLTKTEEVARLYLTHQTELESLGITPERMAEHYGTQEQALINRIKRPLKTRKLSQLSTAARDWIKDKESQVSGTRVKQETASAPAEGTLAWLANHIHEAGAWTDRSFEAMPRLLAQSPALQQANAFLVITNQDNEVVRILDSQTGNIVEPQDAINTGRRLVVIQNQQGYHYNAWTNNDQNVTFLEPDAHNNDYRVNTANNSNQLINIDASGYCMTEATAAALMSRGRTQSLGRGDIQEYGSSLRNDIRDRINGLSETERHVVEADIPRAEEPDAPAADTSKKQPSQFRNISILGVTTVSPQYPLIKNRGMSDNIAYRFRDTLPDGRRRLNIVAHRAEVNIVARNSGRLQIGNGQYTAAEIVHLLQSQRVSLGDYDVVRFISSNSEDIAGDFATLTGKSTTGYRGLVTIEGSANEFTNTFSSDHRSIADINRDIRRKYEAHAGRQSDMKSSSGAEYTVMGTEVIYPGRPNGSEATT